MLCEMFFFSAQICLIAIFYKLREVFILTKNLNTARAPTEMYWNKTWWIKYFLFKISVLSSY